jgi:hypothetical protein
LLNLTRSADHGRAGIKKRLRHINSQASIGPGYEYDFAFHRSSPIFVYVDEIPFAEKGCDIPPETTSR